MTETLRNGKRKAVLEALRNGATRRAACSLVSISEVTLWRWMQADENLCSAVKDAEGAAELYYTNLIKQAACDSWQAAAWWLERRKPADYGRRDTVTVLQQLAKEVQGLSDEQLLTLVAGGVTADSPGEGGA